MSTIPFTHSSYNKPNPNLKVGKPVKTSVPYLQFKDGGNVIKKSFTLATLTRIAAKTPTFTTAALAVYFVNGGTIVLNGETQFKVTLVV